MNFFHLFHNHWAAGVEVCILLFLLYYIYLFLKKTEGARLFIGVILAFTLLTFVAQLFHFIVLNWVLRNVSLFLGMTLVIIFQPELRRMFNEVGLQRLFTSASERRETIEELTNLVFELSRKGFGALIALERDVNLKTWMDTGVVLDALLSQELMVTLFHPKTLLHDGGVIIRGDRILGAGCIFPLSQRDDLDRILGLRHRAGLGLSEETDAIIVIVSEETGQVSLCDRGVIKRHLHEKEFREYLHHIMIKDEEDANKS